MRHIVSKTKLIAGSLVLALGLLVSPVAVLAHQTTDDSDSHGSSSGQGSDSHSGDDNAAATLADDKGGDSLRNRAKQLLDDKRTQVKQRTTEQRQKACTNHQDDINKRFTKLGNKAETYLNRYDTIFAKVRAYQAQKQLDVANYDALLNDVLAKQSAAKTAVTTLKDLAGTQINCTAADPASAVAGVKTATSDARSALQAYRTSLKALIQAMLDVKPTSEGSN